MRKVLVVGIILLFIGASVVSSINLNDYHEKVTNHQMDATGLVAHWSFDEGSGTIAHDISGNGNNGTIYGASWVSGVNNTALNFDGIDDFVNCGTALTGTILSAVTVEAWVHDESVPPYERNYIFFDGSDGEFCLKLTEERKALFHVKLSDGLLGYDINSTTQISNQTWFHLVGIFNYSDSLLKIYVNGELENTTTIPHLTLYNPSGDYFPTIGAYSSANDTHRNYYNGGIDEVRIYNRELSNEEIFAHYQEFVPDIVYVNDDFNSSTPGWGYDHFSSIQAGVDAVNTNGTVYVFSGIYDDYLPNSNQGLVVIGKSINLIGENRDTTIIDVWQPLTEIYGIVIKSFTNDVRISGFTVKGNYQEHSIGILTDGNGGNGHRVENCTVHTFGLGGILLSQTTNCLIKNCTVHDTLSWGGIRIAEGNNYVISDLISYDNNIGIVIGVANSCKIINSTAFDNNDDGIYLTDSNNITVSHCSCFNNTDNGIQISTEGSPIAIYDNKILDCVLYNNLDSGLAILNDAYNSDIFNTIISHCKIYNNNDGVLIRAERANVVAYSKISNNDIFNNSQYGIQTVTYPTQSLIRYNNISDCNIYNNNLGGIYFSYSETLDNIVYHNNFINNAQNAYEENANIWYNASLQEGNFWDDYTGEDNNGDGIGDTPYNITGDDQDLYPLMHPFEMYFILNISLENHEVNEGNTFNVTVKTLGGTVVPNAKVLFDDQIYSTDPYGKTVVTAPSVPEDIVYPIVATKPGYTSDNDTILVKDVPQEFVRAFIFGKITNLSSVGDYTTFESVKIFVITFSPFNFNTYVSGERFTISKDYQGWVGTRYIFALCEILV